MAISKERFKNAYFVSKWCGLAFALGIVISEKYSSFQ